MTFMSSVSLLHCLLLLQSALRMFCLCLPDIPITLTFAAAETPGLDISRYATQLVTQHDKMMQGEHLPQ